MTWLIRFNNAKRRKQREFDRMPNEFALEQRAWVKRWKTGSERLREVTVEEVGPHPMPGTGAKQGGRNCGRPQVAFWLSAEMRSVFEAEQRA